MNLNDEEGVGPSGDTVVPKETMPSERTHMYKVNFCCRICGDISTNIKQCKRWHRKENKIFSFLGLNAYSEDVQGLHSELVCDQCFWKATKVVKSIEQSRRRKTGLSKEERIQAARESENWPEKLADFTKKRHSEVNCQICRINIDIPEVKCLPSKSPLKRIFKTISPEESPVKRTPKSQPQKRRIKFTEQSPGQPDKRRKITVGNQSIRLSQFKDMEVARLLCCQVCKGVPTSPGELKGCQHIYCIKDCFEEWKSVASTCKDTECLQTMCIPTLTQLSGHRLDFYLTLEPLCQYCKTEVPIAEFSLHIESCVHKNKRGKNKHLRKDINELKTRTARKYLLEVTNKLEDFCETNDQDVVQTILKLSEIILKDHSYLKYAGEIIELAKRIAMDKESTVRNKITAAEQGALRKAASISNDQMIAISDFCHSLENKHKEEGDVVHLNPFVSYRQMHKEDVNQLPDNVNFSLVDKNTNEMILQHDAVVCPNPRNILEDFDQDSLEEVLPNICGCYWPPTLVAAKELEGMSPLLKESFNRLLPGELPEEYVFHAVTKISEDGLGQISETRSTDQRYLPTKIFKATQVIVMVFVLKKETNEKVILWKNPAPNSEFEPATFNVYADESDNYSMATITQKMDYYVSELENNLLGVSDLTFNVRVYSQRDGKWWVRSTGTAGATHTFNCTRCFGEGKDIDIEGNPREPNEHNQLATKAIWNFEKKEPLTLYFESKGSSKVGLSQVTPSRVCPDELHLDLNLAENYDHAVPLMLTFCHLNDKHTPKHLKWRCPKKYKDTYKHNQAVWKEHKRSVIGIGQSVQSKSSNPGIVARMTLSKENRHRLFSIVPDCEVKSSFLMSLTKLDGVREITGTMWPTQDQIDSYTPKVTDWVDHRKEKLAWMSNTNIVHILRVHVDPILKDTMGPQSIMVLSSSQLESQNSQVRRCIKYMSYKGMVYRQTEDCLRHAYLSGTWNYKVLIRKHKLDREPFQVHKCSVCGESGHNIRTCKMKIVEFDDGFEESVTTIETNQDSSQLILSIIERSDDESSEDSEEDEDDSDD